MPKPKKKLTASQRAAKAKRKREFMTVFINGKMKRIRREPTIDGMSVEEYIRRNADPIWLHQEERWDLMPSSNPVREPRAEEGSSELFG